MVSQRSLKQEAQLQPVFVLLVCFLQVPRLGFFYTCLNRGLWGNHIHSALPFLRAENDSKSQTLPSPRIFALALFLAAQLCSGVLNVLHKFVDTALKRTSLSGMFVTPSPYQLSLLRVRTDPKQSLTPPLQPFVG